MGWEPITRCRLCEEPFDVYTAHEDRFCDICIAVIEAKYRRYVKAKTYSLRPLNRKPKYPILGKDQWFQRYGTVTGLK